MSLFAIADLHLSGQVNKSMEVFGARWNGYTQKLVQNWRAVVSDEDTVILPGDISWGMNLGEALEDFRLLDSLPGKKLIGKGNHDFWWTTVSKMKSFFAENHIRSIDFLYNNAYAFDDCVVAGTRGWFGDRSIQKTVGEVDYEKIINREAQRLEISLGAAERLQETAGKPDLPIVVFLHFPPVFGEFVCRELIDCLHSHRVRTCYYGHIHGVYDVPQKQEWEDICFRMISADYLGFTPIPVRTD